MLDVTGKSFDQFGDDIGILVGKGVDPSGPVRELKKSVFEGLGNRKPDVPKEKVLRGANGYLDELNVGVKYADEVDNLRYTKRGNTWDIEFDKGSKAYQVEVKHDATDLIDNTKFDRKLDRWDRQWDGKSERVIQVGKIDSATRGWLEGRNFKVIMLNEFPW
jgi:hypothetical protein